MPATVRDFTPAYSDVPGAPPPLNSAGTTSPASTPARALRPGSTAPPTFTPPPAHPAPDPSDPTTWTAPTS